ncbi:hypothetical protein CH373_08400 [Leptospira perolatii]|uniref:5-formyltetrahydrofolate cyclo-ligase n=1 Tax=Leptospira perolatii TaxID=2023191 RepID=A0A2M9ZN59_9LEPT|nr:5-formyltetrahydrofolate cyclo-ligase [Leptospira perolatii]PJZ68682.1 hypothetical protein CH360_14895 [Leptospira perolatii]PJZ73518.1 hypothetical protein CH373_08400 [Leptospira perolatii]
MASKQEARKSAKEFLRVLPGRTESEEKIRNSLKRFLLDQVQISGNEKTALKIISYYADIWEVSPFAEAESILEIQGVRIEFYYPRIEGTGLTFLFPEDSKTGEFGISEPIGNRSLEPKEADFILVPALAFDEFGHRLGRGKGYYDRSLVGVPQGKLIGFTFETMFPWTFSAEDHDIRVGTVMTEKKNHCFP